MSKKCSKHGIEPDCWRFKCMLKGCDVMAAADELFWRKVDDQRKTIKDQRTVMEALWLLHCFHNKHIKEFDASLHHKAYDIFSESTTLDQFIEKMQGVGDGTND